MKDETAAQAPATVASPPVSPLVAQPHGGKLRRGNLGNKGKPKSAVAREILRAATPEAAKVLRRMGLDGERIGEDGAVERICAGDQIKAAQGILDRGDVPVRSELTGADGGPFTVIVGAMHARE